MAERAITVRIIGDPKSLEQAFGKVTAAGTAFEKKMHSIGSSTEKLGKTMTRNVSAPLLAIGVGAVKMTQDFDLLISRLQGLAGVSAKQAQEWRTQLLKLAPIVGKAPAELADGLYQITSAGVKGKAAFEALTVSAKASAAGLGDTATVADAVTSAMNAYAKSGLTAKRAADVLSATVREGKGEASQFAPVLGKVVAVASQLGVSFDQVGAALASMTRLGVPAEDAATQLSATFSGLLKTTPKAEKALNAMGLSSKGLREELRDKGLIATLQTLNEKTHGSTVAMAEAFPNVRALRGVLQLVGTAANDTAGVFHRVEHSTNSLATAWNAYTKTDAAKMNTSLAETKAALIELGGTLAPFVDQVAKDVGKLAEKYNSLSPRQKEFVTKLGEIAIVAGPSLIALGKLAEAVTKVSKAYRALAASEALASKGAVGLLARFGLLAAAAGSVAVATGAIDVAGRTQQNFVGKDGQEIIRQSNGQWFISAGRGGLKPITAKQARPLLKPADAAAAFGGSSTPSSTGADRSNHPGVQGKGGGMLWSGDHAGLNGSFKSKLEACVAAANGTQIYVSSGRRSAAQNTAVHGASNSNHLTGHAADGTCTINGRSYPLGAAPIPYAKYGLRPGASFNWAGSPDIYHVDDGTNVGGPPPTSTPPASADPNYDPLAGSKAAKSPKWKGATEATIATAKGEIAATLKGLPSHLDPVEKTAVAHIKALEKRLRIHMPAAELAKDKVELRKWGKVLHDEISKNAKLAAAAAAEAKKRFDRALALDVSHILRDFDRQFAAVKAKFDKETAAGLLSRAAPEQTSEEKAYAAFVTARDATDLAKSRADALANASTDEERAQLVLGFSLDDQQAALEQAAQASRTAADKKAADDQQAYQDLRDEQWQGLQDINDDQRTALQNSLDDWTTNLEKKKASWTDFLKWLQAHGYDTVGLINPNSGDQTTPPASSTGAMPGRGTIRAIPLAGGGVVTQPTVALVGEAGREAVIPLDSAGITGDKIIDNHITIELDGRTVWAGIKRHAARDSRLNVTTGVK